MNRDVRPLIDDEPQPIKLWIEVLAGRCWDENDSIEKLSNDESIKRHEQLTKIGVPPFPRRRLPIRLRDVPRDELRDCRRVMLGRFALGEGSPRSPANAGS